MNDAFHVAASQVWQQAIREKKTTLLYCLFHVIKNFKDHLDKAVRVDGTFLKYRDPPRHQLDDRGRGLTQ